MNLKSFYCFLLFGVLIGLPKQATAINVNGTVFPDSVLIKNHRLNLKGAALLRYLVVIKAYTGAFYLPPEIPGTQALSDVPKQLVLEYRVSIKAGGFAEATTLYIQKNVDPKTFERLRPKLDDLNSLYRDVKPKDRYALTYIPGYGTELSLNGVPQGVILGKDFAFALFSVWLGAHPIDITFRDTLLGGR